MTVELQAYKRLHVYDRKLCLSNVLMTTLLKSQNTSITFVINVIF